MNKRIMAGAFVLFILISLPLSEAITVLDIAPKDFLMKDVGNVSRESAVNAMEKANLDLADIEKRNFGTNFIKDSIIDINRAVKSKDYKTAIEISQLVDFIRRYEIDLNDKIILLEKKRADLEKKGVSLNRADKLLKRTKIAFKNERFDETKNLIKETKDELDSLRIEYARVKEIAKLSKNFFIRYWWQSIIIFLLIIIIIPILVKKIRKKRAKIKARELELELDNLHRLIIKAQEELFKEKSINKTTYSIRVKRYRARIAEIKHTLPVIRAIAEGKDLKKIRRKKRGIIEVKD